MAQPSRLAKRAAASGEKPSKLHWLGFAPNSQRSHTFPREPSERRRSGAAAEEGPAAAKRRTPRTYPRAPLASATMAASGAQRGGHFWARARLRLAWPGAHSETRGSYFSLLKSSA